MTSLISASPIATGQVQSLDSFRAHSLPSDAMILASATQVNPANQNPGSYAIVESAGVSSLTNNNVVAVTQTPFGDLYKEGSLYFPGLATSNVNATLGASYNWSLGLTAEAWVYYTSFTNSTGTSGRTPVDVPRPCLMGAFQSTVSASMAWSLGTDTNGKLTFYYYGYTGGSDQSANTNISLALNTWNHVAVSIPSGGPGSLYINGVQQTSNTNVNGSVAAASATTFTLNGTPFASYNYLGLGSFTSVTTTGYVADARIVYGAALYTGSSFTVPTAPLGIALSGTTALLLRAGQNSPTIQNGALTFDRGLKQYMNFGPQTFNIATRGFTAVFRYTWNGTATNNERIFQAFPNSGSQASGIAITRNNLNAGLQFIYSLSGAYTFVNSATNLSQGTNYVAAFVYNASTGIAQWWINGAPSGTAGAGLTSSITTDYLCPWTLVGSSFQYDSFGNFSSNTFAVYNRALSNAEIYNSYLALTTTPVGRTIEIGDVNGVPALSVAGDGKVSVQTVGLTSNVLPWPPAAMTGYDTVINGGVYKARASNEQGGTPVWYVFDKTTTNFWQSGGSYNTAAPYIYTASASTTDVNGIIYPGDWVQFQLPTPILLKSYSIASQYNYTGTQPSQWVILGSQNGVNWTLVDVQQNYTAWGVGTYSNFTVSTTASFSYFRIVCIRGGGYIVVGLGDIIYYGTADTSPALTIAPATTFSTSVATPALTGVSGDRYVPQDFSSSGLNIPAYVVSNTATTANTVQYSSFGPFAGEGSLYFPGAAASSGAYVNFPSGTSVASMNPVTAFTAEAFLYLVGTPTPTYCGVFGHTASIGGSENWGLNLNGTNATFFIWSTSGSPSQITGSATFINTWFHIAVSYDGTTLRLFINGALANSTAMVGTPRVASGSIFLLGTNGVFRTGCPMYMADARIVTGAAIYTTAFTPPTGPLQPIQGTTQAGRPYGTVLLLRNAPAPGRVLTQKFSGANSGLVFVFPPAAMTTYATTLNVGYGQGTYVASASSDSGGAAWQGFDGTGTGTTWTTASSLYTSGVPYSGSTVTVDVTGTSYRGEWLQILLPVSIVLSSYSLTPNGQSLWYVLGSRDGINWFLVDQRNTTTTVGIGASYTVTSSQSFSFFRMVVNVVQGVTTASLYEFFPNGTIESINVTNDGRVGLGAVAPTRALEVAGDVVAGGTVSAGNPLMFRNRIINGNFDVWQRGTSFSIASNPTYTSDRWFVTYDGTGATRTITRNTFGVGQTAVPGNPRYYLQWAQTVAGSGSSFNQLQQYIESVLTFAGQVITVSFWAQAVSGTPTITVYTGQLFGTGGSPSAAVYPGVSPTFTLTTAWQYFTWTTFMPSISGKTLGNNGDDSMSIAFRSMVNGTGTYNIASVQVEAGTVATPFEIRPYQLEVQLCQRYYESSYGAETTPGTANQYQNYAIGRAYTTSFVRGVIPYRVAKRGALNTVPTCQVYSFLGTAGKISIIGVGMSDIGNTLTVNATIAGQLQITDSATAFTIGDTYFIGWSVNAEL